MIFSSNLLQKLRSAMPSRVVEVGWAVTKTEASLIWDEPAAFRRDLPKPASAKSVEACPAAIEFDARHFVVPCPVDIHLRIGTDEGKRPTLTNAAGLKSTIRSKHLNKMVVLVDRAEWRHPDRPLLQFITPYIFLADQPAYINQFPPFLHYPEAPWPGLQICGRFPVHIWPRHLMWAFEWYDIDKDLMLHRGQPWFYVRFETDDPTHRVRLVEAELTPEVQRYVDGISGVTNYTNRTFSLLERARARRPRQLLFRRK
jgi:hypothetical protein